MTSEDEWVKEIAYTHQTFCTISKRGVLSMITEYISTGGTAKTQWALRRIL